MKKLHLLCLLFALPFITGCDKDDEKWVDIPDAANVEFKDLPLSQIKNLTVGKWYLSYEIGGMFGEFKEYTRENSPEIIILEKDRYLRLDRRISNDEWIFISWKKIVTIYHLEPVYCFFDKISNDLLYYPYGINKGRLVLKDNMYGDGSSYYYERF